MKHLQFGLLLLTGLLLGRSNLSPGRTGVSNTV